MTSEIKFPADFTWGVATSAYQIEGSPRADGAGISNWDRFSRTPGRIAGNATADIACDHYRRYREDVALLRGLGVGAYRFSIAWSRVLPEGQGPVNAAGLDFYSRLVDLLLENGIRPCATLYHWDHPAVLDDRGGWLNRDMASWFADYTSVVAKALGDRVSMWMTLNEPWVVVDAGFLHDVHPPARRNPAEAPLAAHNLLRAHGLAVRAYRGTGHAAPIGIVINIEPKVPATDSAEDVAACRRAEAWMNRQFLDPLFLGQYPDELREIFGRDWPDFPSSDFPVIGEPTDFLGINYYTRGVMGHDEKVRPLRASYVKQPGVLYTDTGWEVHPEGLTKTLLWVRERYGDRPLYITENGVAFPEPARVSRDVLEDPLRVDYFRNHLRAAQAAIAQGVDLRGYFAWSLLDNFEWQSGTTKRFGLFHVDYETQKRTPKQSAEFYRRYIESRRDG
jgi:beta-glucosidase